MKLKKGLCTLLCLLLVMSGTGVAASAMTAEQWNTYWSNDSEIANAVTIAPGNTESERRFSWYSSSSADCRVIISKNEDMSDSFVFTGEGVKTRQGDFSNKVTVTGLEGGNTYYYVCCDDAYTSSKGTVTTSDGTGFSALYVTDVHMSGDSLENEHLRDNAFKFDSAIESARSKSDISLILSSGDQASSGIRTEYCAFASSPSFDDLTVAMTVGNHDRKNVDYKYYTNNPYTGYVGVKSFVGEDYWFVKDGVLFIVLDTNSPDAAAHRSFINSAVKSNPDVKWRVAMFHHDLFGSRIESRESENSLLRLLLVPLMDEFKIDLVLMGHSHYYTLSNVVYDRKTVSETTGLDGVTDAAGTMYMVSGSLSSPRSADDGSTPPLGENIGYDYLTDEGIYNILTFSEDSIVIDSYTLESDEHFNSFTIAKTSSDGGHPTFRGHIYNGFVRAVSAVVAVFNNIGRAWDLYKDEGITMSPCEAIFG